MADLAARLDAHLIVARNATGAAAVKVIENVTSATGVYVFSEILELPGIQALAKDQTYDRSVRLLQLFAYGQLSDYNAEKGMYPELSAAQLNKLKHLTLVTLAHSHRSLSYESIQSSLELGSIRELEDLVIEAIYGGLLGGKLHHHEKVLHIDWVAGRDTPPAALPDLAHKLENWCQTAWNLLDALDHRIGDLQDQSRKEAIGAEDYDKRRNKAFAEVQKQGAPKRGGGRQLGNGGSGDVMSMGGGGSGRMPATRGSDIFEGRGVSKRFKDHAR